MSDLLTNNDLWYAWEAGYEDALYYHNMDQVSDPNRQTFQNWLVNVMQRSVEDANDQA